MSKLQSVDVVVFGTTISLLSDTPDELIRIANELTSQISKLASKYPNVPNNLLLTLAGLKLTEENSSLKKEIEALNKERDKLNNTIQNFLNKID